MVRLTVPINNPRGSALLEAAPVMLLLAVFAAGICLAAYLFFARAWIQYQNEQALHCAGERRGGLTCKYELEEKLNRFLPWGESTALVQATNDQWTVEVQWKYAEFSFHLVKTLSPKQILAAKALQW
jgi:hypothetical protein